MSSMKKLLAISLLAFTPSLAMAEQKEDHLLSVHVLNQQTGKPAEGVTVKLDKKENNAWKTLNEIKTDKEGRANALFTDKTDPKKLLGEYRVTFETKKYFSSQNKDSFFPEIPVILNISDSAEHYHLPLLLNQYGYSTYRGQ